MEATSNDKNPSGIHQDASLTPQQRFGAAVFKTRGDFVLPLKSSFFFSFPVFFLLHNFHAEPRSASLDGYQSSTEALITSAPSFHLCNPRAPSLVCLVMWRDEEIDQGFISTEGLIARAPSPSLPSTAVLQDASNAITNCLVPIRAHGGAASIDALYGTCARSASPSPK